MRAGHTATRSSRERRYTMLTWIDARLGCLQRDVGLGGVVAAEDRRIEFDQILDQLAHHWSVSQQCLHVIFIRYANDVGSLCNSS
jgi:hypothetical protein